MGGQRIDQWERVAMPCHEGHCWTQGCRFGFKLVGMQGWGAYGKGGRGSEDMVWIIVYICLL